MLNKKIYLFADDTKIFREMSSRADYDILQSDIDALINWSNSWLLNFNLDKCVSMQMGENCENHKYKFTLESSVQNLESVTSIKDLGVTIDDQLCFEKHIHEKINKANSINGIIRRSYKFLNVENFLPLWSVVTLIMPDVSGTQLKENMYIQWKVSREELRYWFRKLNTYLMRTD